ncbi:Hypothetical Protein FCC1311_090782 [Hondaea fermentalgiana]|uniref:Uncharacterized protein n=1 Tax=Hondaea fermentalgiana TaxID=2315210 RepID=A0A2R5GW09_9STRA|nr:Hypothetical Protein FCC1311_090782 [Hondaea fermentalgiana]|eukprot:GBG32853.1 Hypothetical Protein FCC1311_090782 [Hondaea fermentalgiana]
MTAVVRKLMARVLAVGLAVLAMLVAGATAWSEAGMQTLLADPNARELWRIANEVPVSQSCQAGCFRKKKSVAYNGFTAEQVAHVMQSFASACASAASAEALHECVASSYASEFGRDVSALMVTKSSSSAVASVEGGLWLEYFAGDPCQRYQVTLFDRKFDTTTDT